MSRASSFGPGERTAADRMAPRLRQNLLAHSKPEARLLLMANQRQVDIEQVFRLVAAAGRKQRAHGHQHLGIGKTCHDAVCAAREFLRHIQSAVADHDADIASRGAIACLADLRELLQARTVFVLEHHDARMRVDDLEEASGRDVGLGRLRVVLVDHRNFFAQRRDDVGEVGDDLGFRLQAGQRRDHDAAGASVHRDLAELDEVRSARIGYADDDRHAAADAAQEMASELGRFLVAELLGLAHHAEHGQALDAALQIEFDQAVDARASRSRLHR